VTATETTPTDPTERERWLDALVTLDEGARLRNVSKFTLRREGQKGRIRLYHVGERAIRVRRREVLMLDSP
jgi:hypothetical protein